MHISGDGFTGFDVKIKPNFKPNTRLALKWEQLANGNYIVVDRMQSNDIYETDISMYGRQDEIDVFVEAIQLNRFSGTSNANRITLSGFNDAEQIFGAEVLYTERSIPAMVVKIKEKEQGTWLGYGLKLTIRALGDIPKKNITPLFPEYQHVCIEGETDYKPENYPYVSINIGFTGDSELDLKTDDSYSGDPFFIDSKSDAGFFEGTFTLRTDEMAKLRMFLIENRGQVITSDTVAGGCINALPGVGQRLFGRRRESAGPFDVRIAEWKDMGMIDQQFWSMKMKIVEEA